jgi:protein SCO1/2
VKRFVALLGLPLVAALLVAGCSSSKPAAKASQLNDNPGGTKFAGFAVTPAQPRPSFTLTDTDGKPFSFGLTTHAHPTLLYFGYTHCPDVCPETMADVGLALRALPVAVQKQTYVVFVTTDVKRDTSAVIARWLKNFSPGTQATWVGLHGTQAEIDAAQVAAKVTVAEDDGATHAAQVLLFGTDDYARVVFPQSTNEQQEIVHDLPLVAGSGA